MSERAIKVIEGLEQATGKEKVTEDMVFGKDIIITSVNAMKLSFDLENALDIDCIPPDIFYDVQTVADLIKVVESL